MNIIRLAGEIFLIYILYRLIFDFIIPIYQTTKKVKRQFGEMQSKMQDQMDSFDSKKSAQSKAASAQPQKKKEEYIDYEEIKE